jgi:hypothetical protein
LRHSLSAVRVFALALTFFPAICSGNVAHAQWPGQARTETAGRSARAEAIRVALCGLS